MAVHPLRPATDRRLGGPLPLQLANQTQAPPPAKAPKSLPFFPLPCDRKNVFGISSRFQLLSPSERQVAHALLTRSPLTREPKLLRPFDLHVLGTPPAFVLSQDQTLHDIWKSVWLLFIDWYYSLFDVLYNRTSHVGVHSVHCSVFKGHRCHHRVATTCLF